MGYLNRNNDCPERVNEKHMVDMSDEQQIQMDINPDFMASNDSKYAPGSQ